MDIYIDGERQNKIFIGANPDIPGHGQISQIWQSGKRIYLEAADIQVQPSECGTTVPAAGEKFYIHWGTQKQIQAFPNSETDVRYRFVEWQRADRNGENVESYGVYNPLVITGDRTWREFEKPQLIPTYQAQYRLVFETDGDATLSPSGIVWRDDGSVVDFTVTANQQPGRFYRVRRIGLWDSTTNEFLDWRWEGDVTNPTPTATIQTTVPITIEEMPDRPVGTRDTYIDPRDGEEYDYVRMPDGKFWLVENVRYDVPGSSHYDHDPSKGATYGKLYSWQEAQDAVVGFGEGWRLPSQAEYTALAEALGGRAVAGGKLKSGSEWDNGGDGTDDYGFTALPGGVQNWDGTFSSMGEVAYLYTSETAPTPPDGTYGLIEALAWDSDALTITQDNKYTRRSIRFVVDDDPNPRKPGPSINKFIAEINEYAGVNTEVQGTGAIDPSRNCDFGFETSFTTTADNPTNQTHRIKSVDQISSLDNSVVRNFAQYDVDNIQDEYTAEFMMDTTWRAPANNLRATWQEYIPISSGIISISSVEGEILGDFDRNYDVGDTINVTANATPVLGRSHRVAGFFWGPKPVGAGPHPVSSAILEYDLASPSDTETLSFPLTTAARVPSNCLIASLREYVYLNGLTAGSAGTITGDIGKNADLNAPFSVTATRTAVTGQSHRVVKFERTDSTGAVQGEPLITYSLTSPVATATYNGTLTDAFRTPMNYVKATFAEYVYLTGVVSGSGTITGDVNKNIDIGTNISVTATRTAVTNQSHRVAKFERVNSSNAVQATLVTYPITDIATTKTLTLDLDTNYRTANNYIRAVFQEYVYLNGLTAGSAGTITGDVNKNIDIGSAISVTATVTAVSGQTHRVSRFDRTNSSGTAQGSALATYAVSNPAASATYNGTLTTDFRVGNNYIKATMIEYFYITRGTGTNGSITSGANANVDLGSTFSVTLTPSSPSGQTWRAERVERVNASGTVQETLATRGGTYNTSAWTPSAFTTTTSYRNGATIRPVFKQYVYVTRAATTGTGASYATVTGASQNADVGATLTFSVSFSPSAAANSVQWQETNASGTWVNISGATSTTLTYTVPNRAVSIRASVPIRTYSVSLSRSPSGTWITTPTLSGGGTYSYGDTASISAASSGRYNIAGWGERTLTFNYWSSGNARTHTRTVTGSISDTAYYRC